MEKTRCHNKLFLQGTVGSDLVFSHELFEEKFYTFVLRVDRLSNQTDEITVQISSRILGDFKPVKGQVLIVLGQLRSYNRLSGGKNKLILTVFAKSLRIPQEKALDPNVVELEGYICKAPIYRTTPFGREICDLLVAVNRSFNKSDYIPVIAWGHNARVAKGLKVGQVVEIQGRFQSRIYEKELENHIIEKRVAYELSVSQLKLKTEEKDSDGDHSNEIKAHRVETMDYDYSKMA